VLLGKQGANPYHLQPWTLGLTRDKFTQVGNMKAIIHKELEDNKVGIM